MERLWELFELGGEIMWPILGCSIVAIALFIERVLAIRVRHVVPTELDKALTAHLTAGDVPATEALVRADSTPLGRIAWACLRNRTQGRSVMKEAMEEAGDIALARLERFLPALATIAAIAPLLGLLGTITGMIEVFGELEKVKQADIGMFAGGIWEALITTGFGLIVAIPVLVGHRFLEGRLERFGIDLEERAVELLELMERVPKAAGDKVDHA